MFAQRAPGACPACYLCIKYPTLAPNLSSPREVPQVDRTGPQPSVQSTLHKPKYENSTTQNVSPTTSNHHPCHHHKLGARDRFLDTARGTPHCLVRGGLNRHGWGMVNRRCPASAWHANTPPKAHLVCLCPDGYTKTDMPFNYPPQKNTKVCKKPPPKQTQKKGKKGHFPGTLL